MAEAAVGHALLARLAALRDEPQPRTGLLADLREVEHGADPRFALTLDHYLESWLGGRPREVFQLPERRLLILAAAEAAPLLEGGAKALAQMLRVHGFGTMRFAAYDLPADLDRLVGAVTPPGADGRMRLVAAADRAPTAALDQVLAVERVLRGADVESLLREETLWSFADPQRPEPRLTELAVSLDELEARLDLPLRRDAWLRHEVASLLDRGLLRHVALDRWRSGRSYAFDLHTATVLDDGFAALARAVPAELRRRMTAELAAWELGLSADRVVAAAARLADVGMAVAIDHVPLAMLPALDLRGVPAAYVKTLWSAAEDAPALLRAGAGRLGADRLALWRCDTAAAVAAGEAAGVRLFQGAAADAVAAEREALWLADQARADQACAAAAARSAAAPAAHPGVLIRLGRLLGRLLGRH
ncbi:hypothetical protein [Azospirillum sp. ST 5-10]|uniref:hypothetical protein n=1 Tax=unclassified Azospirillum TaxID=2630922 RepID=UPI003F49F786